MDACKGPDFEDKRDMALIGLMLDAGLRRGEAAGIMLEELALEGKLVKITGKGNRPGVAFFGAKTARDFDRYLRGAGSALECRLAGALAGSEGRPDR